MKCTLSFWREVRERVRVPTARRQEKEEEGGTAFTKTPQTSGGGIGLDSIELEKEGGLGLDYKGGKCNRG